ncbi:MAG: hypothetical protein HY738_00600 [Bacteroidia bacterium]|nr:hypothetical protein [Bacteroidia bacterium]
MENYFKNKSIVQILNKWKFHLIIIMAIALLGSTLVSLLIRNKYESYAIVYPVNLGLFSEESQSEQMQQMLDSRDIKDNVIEKFNLGKRYKLNKNKKNFQDNVYKIYNDNIKIRKTEYESVVITVLDYDADTACAIAKAILDFYNIKIRSLHRNKFQEVVDIKTREMKMKQREIDTLQAIMSEFGKKYNILHYDEQVEELTKGYVKFLASGKESSSSLNEIKKTLDNIKEYGQEFKEITTKLWNALDVYNKIKNDYETALEEVEKKITYYQIVSEPYPSYKKAYPIRWLVVVLTEIIYQMACCCAHRNNDTSVQHNCYWDNRK